MNIRKNSPAVWAGRLVKTVSFSSDEALIIWIDHVGRIQERHVPIESLKSFSDAMQPRSLWPDSFQGDDTVRTRAPNKQRVSRNRRAAA